MVIGLEFQEEPFTFKGMRRQERILGKVALFSYDKIKLITNSRKESMVLAKKVQERFSYSDYVTWSDDERWEIINGIAYNISPAPTVKHQELTGNVFSFLKQKLKGKPCKPFMAPTDVVLSENDVVQPDIFVVCDPKKITEKNIQGAPDLVVEILSPSTALKDKREKKALYEKFGVAEYLLIDPVGLYAERFTLTNEKFTESELLGVKETIKLSSLAQLEVPLWEIFEVEPTQEEKRNSPYQ